MKFAREFDFALFERELGSNNIYAVIFWDFTVIEYLGSWKEERGQVRAGSKERSAVRLQVCVVGVVCL